MLDLLGGHDEGDIQQLARQSLVHYLLRLRNQALCRLAGIPIRIRPELFEGLVQALDVVLRLAVMGLESRLEVPRRGRLCHLSEALQDCVSEVGVAHLFDKQVSKRHHGVLLAASSWVGRSLKEQIHLVCSVARSDRALRRQVIRMRKRRFFWRDPIVLDIDLGRADLVRHGLGALFDALLDHHLAGDSSFLRDHGLFRSGSSFDCALAERIVPNGRGAINGRRSTWTLSVRRLTCSLTGVSTT